MKQTEGVELRIRVPVWLGKALASWPGSVLMLVFVLVLVYGPVQGTRLAEIDIHARQAALEHPLFGLYLVAYYLSAALCALLVGHVVASLRQPSAVVEASRSAADPGPARPPRLLLFFGSRWGVFVLMLIPVLALVGVAMGVADPRPSAGKLAFVSGIAVWWGVVGLMYSGARSAIDKLPILEP